MGPCLVVQRTLNPLAFGEDICFKQLVFCCGFHMNTPPTSQLPNVLSKRLPNRLPDRFPTNCPTGSKLETQEVGCFKTITAPKSFATTYSIAPILAKEGAVIVFKALASMEWAGIMVDVCPFPFAMSA